MSMLWVYGHYKYFYSFSAGINFIRQDSNVDPLVVKINSIIFPLTFHRVRATALHWACTNGFSDCVSVLLSGGADTNLQTSSGRTPLMLAARAGHDDIVEQLITGEHSLSSVLLSDYNPLFVV